MKLFPRSFCLQLVRVLCVVGLLGMVLTGCGHRHRPASSLSKQDKDTLDGYENIRAALVEDDLRGAKKAAKDLGTFLKPTPQSPTTPLDGPVHDLADAANLDKARVAFQTLSASLVPLADGVEGYYIMNSPALGGAEWVQKISQVDNPYMGRAMRDVGTARK